MLLALHSQVEIKWLDGALTNICYNCLDRNIERGLGDQIAFYFEGNDPSVSSTITFVVLSGGFVYPCPYPF